MKSAISVICIFLFAIPFVSFRDCQARLPAWSICQDDLKVGDKVKFEFLGDELVGTVIGFTGPGWPRVKFMGRFGQQETILPPGGVLERIGSAGDEDNGDDNSGGMQKGDDTGKTKSQHEYRTWTDKAGNELEARFVELDFGKVKLEKRDGTTITVDTSDLSIGDMQVALKLSVQETIDNSPFDNNVFDKKEKEEIDPADSGYNIIDFDFSGVKPIAVTTTKWELRGESESPTADWEPGQSFSMKLQASHSAGVVIDPRVPSRGFVRATNVLDSPEGFLFDSKSGKTVGPIQIPTPGSKILAYDAVGHRLLTTTSWSRKNKTIDVWNLTRDGANHEFSFSPYPPETRIQLPPGQAQFVDGDRIAVVFFHQLAFYDLTGKKSLCGIQFDRGSNPTFGLEGKYAFGVVDKHVVAIDLQSASQVAQSPVTMTVPSAKIRQPEQLFSVSPDLTRVVTIRQRFLEVYDLASGDKLESFFLPTVRERQPYFLDNENVFITSIMGGSLVNIPLKSAIWNYTFCNFTFGPLASREIWQSTNEVVGSNDGWSGNFTASAVTIPNDEASKIIQSLNLDDLVVLKPGDSVSLKLSAAGSGAAAITEQLVANGFRIDPNSPTVLKATVTKGKSEKREFRDATSPSGSQSATFSSEHFQLELIQRGKTVWYIKGGSSSKELSGLVVLDEGETVQSVANAGRINAGQFFSALTMPELFVRIPEKGFYGFTGGVEIPGMD